MKIPLCIPDLGRQEERALVQTLRSGWLVHGRKNDEFEHAFAKLVGVKHAVTVNSCASALFLAIKALGISGEVIVPSFTFAASANAIVAAGATPVFVDIDARTLTVDPDRVETAITRRTEAIMPVHIAGLPCDMTRIMAVARKHRLAIVEDSAQTIGGQWCGRQAGSFGAGCFSFFPTKNLTTGEGGMVTTDDAAIARSVRLLAAHGIDKRNGRRSAIVPGYNMRMSNLLAAIGVEQLKKLRGMNAARRRHARYLTRELADITHVRTPLEPAGARHVYQMYIVRVETERDRLLRHLHRRGVGATTFADPPVHLQDCYRRFKSADVPVTRSVSRGNIVLPLFPRLTKPELDHVVDSIRVFYARSS